MIEHAEDVELLRYIILASCLSIGARLVDHIGDEHCVEYPHSKESTQHGCDADSVLRLLVDACELSAGHNVRKYAAFLNQNVDVSIVCEICIPLLFFVPLKIFFELKNEALLGAADSF